MLQVNVRDNNVFDAVVVGSGCTGGMAAKELTEAGLRVCVLEAGPPHDEADYTEHMDSYQYKYRNSSNPKAPFVTEMRPMQSKTYACREGNYKWFVNDIKNPYQSTKDEFRWIRCRVVGGRSLTWGRQSYRHGDIDFKAASRDGYGIDWPIAFKDLEPYYEKIERYIGISGLEEGLPQLPDSIFMPPMGFTCGETRFRNRLKDKMGRVATIGRSAIITQDHNGRSACHYCGPCEQGCITHSYYASPTTSLKVAAETGRLTLISDAPVSHVTKDKRTGLANGVAYVDAKTRQTREIRAKVVLLCASTLESTRILLNSEPGGMANSSGALGHYLMDHIYGGGAAGDQPDGLPIKAWSGVPRRPNGMYIPRFRNIDRTHTNGFIRGYGYQGRSSCDFNLGAKGFGANYKKAVHDEAGWSTGFGAWCECLPRYENFVELNHDVKDAYGIPTLKIHMEWSDNEYAVWNDAREQAAEMLEATGHKNVRLTGAPSKPGFCIHEVGTARMSENPKQGVLNGYAQAHDVKNLFVTDGAAWTSVACQNPTLTMMAITARTCDYIQGQLKKGALA